MISRVCAGEIRGEIQHEQPVLGLSDTLRCHDSCPPAFRPCETKTLGERSFHNDITSDQGDPIPFSRCVAAVKRSRSIGIYLLDGPYSGEISMGIEPNQRFPHVLGTEFASIWQWESRAVLEHDVLVNVTDGA